MTGRFITFEGIEGCGKSTQAKRLRAHLESQGHRVLLTREPGGTPISEAIRTLLLNPDHAEMKPATELLLYQAARAQHVEEVIAPALANGTIVICDRFADSTLAYQGAGRSLSPEILRAVLDPKITMGVAPDLTILIDLDVSAGLERSRRDQPWDRIEQESSAFHERVRAAFLEIARSEPKRVRVVDGAQPFDAVEGEVRDAVSEVFRL